VLLELAYQILLAEIGLTQSGQQLCGLLLQHFPLLLQIFQLLLEELVLLEYDRIALLVLYHLEIVVTAQILIPALAGKNRTGERVGRPFPAEFVGTGVFSEFFLVVQVLVVYIDSFLKRLVEELLDERLIEDLLH
jgi:hypothetical protein